MISALLGQFLPYIIGGFGLLAAFFGFKRHYEGKGRVEERERWNQMERERRDIEDALVDEARRARRDVEHSTFDDLMSDDGFRRKG